MAANRRVTQPMLDVLEYLLWAEREGRTPHGYEIMRTTMRPGPTVYNVLDKLEDLGWVTAAFELRNADHPGNPPRRLYQLTINDAIEAEQLLAKRRPHRTTPPTFTVRSAISRAAVWWRLSFAG